MPIFNKKLNKNIPSRSNRLSLDECPRIHGEKIDDFKETTLLLNDVEYRFVDGSWFSTTNIETNLADYAAMKKRVKSLEQELNMMQVKNNVLLDMLTENVIELNLIKK